MHSETDFIQETSHFHPTTRIIPYSQPDRKISVFFDDFPELAIRAKYAQLFF